MIQSCVKTLRDTHRERIKKMEDSPDPKVRLKTIVELESKYKHSCYSEMSSSPAKIKGISEVHRMNQYEADLALFSMKTVTKIHKLKKLCTFVEGHRAGSMG